MGFTREFVIGDIEIYLAEICKLMDYFIFLSLQNFKMEGSVFRMRTLFLLDRI